MKRVSSGIILFNRKEGLRYLLLYRKANDKYRELWVFPRGNIEENESDKEAAVRETLEETGIKEFRFVENFKEKISWFYRMDGKSIFKESIFFLAETKIEDVIISDEHDEYKWCTFEEALKLLKFKNARDVLKKANDYLKNG